MIRPLVGIGFYASTRSIKCSYIEHLSEYHSNVVAKHRQEATVMTHMSVIDERDLMWLSVAVREPVRPAGVRVLRPRGHRPGPVRPRVAPLRYRGTGVAMSRVSHQTKKVSTRVTLALAGLAALITVCFGSLANLSGGASVSPQVPEQLAGGRV